MHVASKRSVMSWQFFSLHLNGRPVAIRFWFLKLLIIKSELRPANRHSNLSEEFAHNNFLSFKSLVVQDRDFTREVRRLTFRFNVLIFFFLFFDDSFYFNSSFEGDSVFCFFFSGILLLPAEGS